MRIQIYGTMAADKSVTNGITLLLREGAAATPAHPDRGAWSYVTTIDTEGTDAAAMTRTALRAIEMQGFYIRSAAEDE